MDHTDLIKMNEQLLLALKQETEIDFELSGQDQFQEILVRIFDEANVDLKWLANRLINAKLNKR